MTEATAPDLRPQLFGAERWVIDLVNGVRDDRLSAATPCTQMDVRHLIGHLGMVFEKIVAFGEQHADPHFGMDYSNDTLERIRAEYSATYVDGQSAAERAERLTALARRAEEVWTDDLLDTPIQLGWGPVLPGRSVSGIYLMEVLAHGWDLATATGQNAEAPQEIAETALSFVQVALPKSPRGMENGVPFGPVVESAPDAGPTERLANWTGRVSR